MSEISEVLMASYDSGGEDISCLLVARKENDEITVLNEFHGAEADKLYRELVTRRVPIVPVGKWIKGQEISRTMIGDKIEYIEYKDYTCSNCGLVLDNLLYNYDGSPFYKFCPNCGAKMKGE